MNTKVININPSKKIKKRYGKSPKIIKRGPYKNGRPKPMPIELGKKVLSPKQKKKLYYKKSPSSNNNIKPKSKTTSINPIVKHSNTHYPIVKRSQQIIHNKKLSNYDTIKEADFKKAQENSHPNYIDKYIDEYIDKYSNVYKPPVYNKYKKTQHIKTKYKKTNKKITTSKQSDFKKVKFKFSKNLYRKSPTNYNKNILKKVRNKQQHFKNLPKEDVYICSSLCNNISVKKYD